MESLKLVVIEMLYDNGCIGRNTIAGDMADKLISNLGVGIAAICDIQAMELIAEGEEAVAEFVAGDRDGEAKQYIAKYPTLDTALEFIFNLI